MKSSTTVSDVTASSENSSTDMKPDSNIVADSCSDEIGTQLLTDYPQQILEFFHTQLHMPVWSGLIVLTCGFCVSTTLLYVGVVRLLQGFILPIKVGNTMEKLLVYRGAQIDGFRGGSILSILRCNHFFSILQAGLLFTVVLNGIHGQHTVESNAVSMHNGGIFWFTDLTACDLYGALPLITCITYFCAWRVRDYILLEDTDPELETKLAATVASPFVYRTALSKSNDVSLLPNFPFSKMLMLSMNRLYGMITFSKPHKGKNVDRKSSRQARTPDSSVYLRNMVDRTGGIVLSWMYLIVLLHPPAAYALCFATMNVYSLLQFYIVKYLNIRSFLKTRIRVDVEDVKTPEDNLLKQYETCYRESLQRYRKEIEDRKGKNGGDLFDDPEQNPTKHCDTNEVSDKARQKVDANK